MPSIFTRAKAARKVLHLLHEQCGVEKSRQLTCDTRLESDLGISGDDAYELLEAMHAQGVDMTGFDCGDHISPECTPLLPLLLWTACVFALGLALHLLFPMVPLWLIYTVALLSVSYGGSWLSRTFFRAGQKELRLRDLILSCEARRWVSPKA